MYITQVVRVVDSLLAAVEKFQSTGNSGAQIEPAVLMAGKGVDQINVTKLVQYISESKLARKVEGYSVCVPYSRISSVPTHDDLLTQNYQSKSRDIY